jgi:hypothetical protein
LLADECSQNGANFEKHFYVKTNDMTHKYIHEFIHMISQGALRLFLIGSLVAMSACTSPTVVAPNSQNTNNSNTTAFKPDASATNSALKNTRQSSKSNVSNKKVVTENEAKRNQISNAVVNFGTGYCQTQRTAIYQDNDLIEIVFDRPKSANCQFKELVLIVDEIALYGPVSVSGGIVKGNTYYRWQGKFGSVFFTYTKELDKNGLDGKSSRIFGLYEVGCREKISCFKDSQLTVLDAERIINNTKIANEIAINNTRVADAIVSSNFFQMLELYKKIPNEALLKELIKKAKEENLVSLMLAIYEVSKDNKILIEANQMALSNKKVSDLMQIFNISKDPIILNQMKEIAVLKKDFNDLVQIFNIDKDELFLKQMKEIALIGRKFDDLMLMYDVSKDVNLLNAIKSNDFLALLAAFKVNKDTSILTALISNAKEQKSANKMLAIYSATKDSKILTVAIGLGFKNSDFDDLMDVYVVTKDKEVLKIAYDVASTETQRQRVELILVTLIKDSLFDFKIAMNGTGKSKSIDQDGIIARRVENVVTSILMHSGKLKKQIFEPKFDYIINTTIVLTIEGVENGAKNCGLLGFSTCEINNEKSTRKFEYNIPMTFKRTNNYVSSGSTEIEWKSVSGGSGVYSGLFWGGHLIFKSNGIFKFDVKVNSISLL